MTRALAIGAAVVVAALGWAWWTSTRPVRWDGPLTNGARP